MQHAGDPAQQRLHLRLHLQGPAPGHRHRLGRGTGGHHILRGNAASAAAAQQIEQLALFGLTAQVAFVEHQQQALAQAGQGQEHLHLGGPQVAIDHQQQQVRRGGLFAGELFALLAGRPGLQDAWGVDQHQAAAEAPQPQPVAAAGPGRAHGGAHLTHHLAQQGPDQGGFADRAAAEDHQHQIPPLQLGFHPQPFLLQGLALHVIADPLQQLVDRRQVLLGRLLAVARWLDRGFGVRWALGFADQVSQPGPGQPADH